MKFLMATGWTGLVNKACNDTAFGLTPPTVPSVFLDIYGHLLVWTKPGILLPRIRYILQDQQRRLCLTMLLGPDNEDLGSMCCIRTKHHKWMRLNNPYYYFSVVGYELLVHSPSSCCCFNVHGTCGLISLITTYHVYDFIVLFLNAYVNQIGFAFCDYKPSYWPCWPFFTFPFSVGFGVIRAWQPAEVHLRLLVIHALRMVSPTEMLPLKLTIENPLLLLRKCGIGKVATLRDLMKNVAKDTRQWVPWRKSPHPFVVINDQLLARRVHLLRCRIWKVNMIEPVLHHTVIDLMTTKNNWIYKSAKNHNMKQTGRFSS